MNKLFTLFALALVTTAAIAQQGTRYAPSTFSAVSRGSVIGNLKTATNMDGNYLTFLPSTNQPVVMEFGTTINFNSAASVANSNEGTLTFNVASLVSAGGTVVFEVQMLDWTTKNWTTVLTEKTLRGGISSVNEKGALYVHPQTGETRVRLVWRDYARVKAVGVDAVQWTFSK